MKITIEGGKNNTGMQVILREIAWMLKEKGIHLHPNVEEDTDLDPNEAPGIHSDALNGIANEEEVYIAIVPKQMFIQGQDEYKRGR